MAETQNPTGQTAQHGQNRPVTILQDFGMHVVKRTDDKVWYRGYGPDNYVYYAQKGEKKFLGGAYEVESEAELRKAANIPGAGKIEELSNNSSIIEYG